MMLYFNALLLFSMGPNKGNKTLVTLDWMDPFSNTTPISHRSMWEDMNSEHSRLGFDNSNKLALQARHALAISPEKSLVMSSLQCILKAIAFALFLDAFNAGCFLFLYLLNHVVISEEDSESSNNFKASM
jgi:hypothetical protein